MSKSEIEDHKSASGQSAAALANTGDEKKPAKAVWKKPVWKKPVLKMLPMEEDVVEGTKVVVAESGPYGPAS